jgi:hypothetical protein
VETVRLERLEPIRQSDHQFSIQSSTERHPAAIKTSSLPFHSIMFDRRKRELLRIADDEQRAVSQICEMLLYDGVET